MIYGYPLYLQDSPISSYEDGSLSSNSVQIDEELPDFKVEMYQRSPNSVLEPPFRKIIHQAPSTVKVLILNSMVSDLLGIFDSFTYILVNLGCVLSQRVQRKGEGVKYVEWVKNLPKSNFLCMQTHKLFNSIVLVVIIKELINYKYGKKKWTKWGCALWVNPNCTVLT